MVPVEVFGRAKFPAITENPYLLSLGPHAFYWFHLQPRETTQESLERQRRAAGIAGAAGRVGRRDVFSEETLQKLQHIIPAHVARAPVVPGQAPLHYRARHCKTCCALPDTSAHLLFLNVEYGDGDPEVYLVPISVADRRQG